MTTEAVELRCGVPLTEPYESKSNICLLPIRQRTSGPCVVRQGRGEATTCDREWDEHYFDEQLTLGHEHDPGYDHVDLEGACAHQFPFKACGEGVGAPIHDSENTSPELGFYELYDHDYVPPVLPLPHEATV